MNKKMIMTAALAAVIGLTGIYHASATPGMAGMKSPADCPRAAAMAVAELDGATKAKLEAFREENQALRKEIMMKWAEKKAIMRGEDPDPKKAAQVTGELFDLQATMQAKAKEAGLDQYMEMRMGQGCGKCSMHPHGPRGMMGGQ